MIYLLLSILFSTLLLVNFRVFPKFKVNTTQSISLNYVVCFITGLFLLPKGEKLNFDWGADWTWYCLALGVGFIITFILSGLSTQKHGMSITSLANNVSLVIPVVVSILFLNTTGKEFDFWNYAGLGVAILAVGLCAIEPGTKLQKAFNWLPVLVFLMYGVTNATINILNLFFIPFPERIIPVTLVMVLGSVVSGLVLVIYKYFKIQEKVELKSLYGAISLGVPNFLSFYFLMLALGSFGNSGAFVFPVYNISVILISSAVAWFFFKEKLHKNARWGLILAVFALILISHQELSAFL